MSDLARRERPGTVADAAAARGALDSREALRYLGLSEKDPRAHALLLVCHRYGLDPLLGHISIYKEKVYVHFAAYLHLANQHPGYQGMECIREWEDAKYCYAEVRVHRSDRAFPFQRRGKSLKIKPKKDGKGTYDDHEADAKAFAQAARRALRLAFNVEWPEPEPERDPAAEEAAPPGPVAEVARRVDAATAPAPPAPPEAGYDFDPETDELIDPETGQVFEPIFDEPPPAAEDLDEYGWPAEPDDQQETSAGPAATAPAGSAAKPPQTSGAGPVPPPAPGPPSPGRRGGRPGDTTPPPARRRGPADGTDNPSLMDGGGA